MKIISLIIEKIIALTKAKHIKQLIHSKELILYIKPKMIASTNIIILHSFHH